MASQLGGEWESERENVVEIERGGENDLRLGEFIGVLTRDSLRFFVIKFLFYNMVVGLLLLCIMLWGRHKHNAKER